MTSTFGWLDSDTEQRRRMLEVVDLFREQGTLDELGIGAIRDTLANALFPGTSELHTRLRYALLIPWLMQRAADKHVPADMSTEFRHLEYRMIDSLMAGGEQRGVIGNTARGDLKRMPSTVYWSALRTWGIHTGDFTSDGYFRRASDFRALARRTALADDPEARDPRPSTGIDPHLPPPPDGLLRATDFSLTPAEEQYLSDRITRSTSGSLLAWLILNPPTNSPDHLWDIDNVRDLPPALSALVDHAQRFHTAIDGAGLTYHLLLARASGRDEAEAAHESELARWREQLEVSRTLRDWSRPDWWATIRARNPRLSLPTIRFVDAWLDLMARGDDPARSTDVADLITTRERRMKGTRARLSNQAALDRWSGGGGRYDLRFRWLVARSHLQDLYSARSAW